MRTKFFVFALVAATLLAACAPSAADISAAMVAALDARDAAATTMAPTATQEPAVDPTVTPASEETQPAEEAATEAALANTITVPSSSVVVAGSTIDMGHGLISVNLADSVVVKKPSAEYVNTLGYGSEYWMAEPGVRTADAGDPGCDPQFSCWHINPDNQHDLTAIAGEAIDLNEDAFTMCAFSRGTFTFAGEAQITFAPTPMHSWLFVMKGLPPGEGDRNTQVVVTDYDAGFMTCTNLPAGAMISEDYVFQNFENMFNELCGAIDHCSSGSLVFYGHEKKVITAFYQGSPQGDLVHVIKNLTIGQ